MNKKIIILISLFITSSVYAADKQSTQVIVNEALKESAVANNIDVTWLRALCATESGLNPNARVIADGKGVKSSYGLCMIQLDTAKHLGFKGTVKELFNPHVNAFYAGKILSYWLKRSHGNYSKAVSYYNIGHKIKGIYSPKVIKVLLAKLEGK